MTAKRLLTQTAFACAVTFSLCGPVLAQGYNGQGSANASPSACNPGQAVFCQSSVSVPEIGGQGAAAALALVFGALVLMTSYRRREV